MHNLFLADDDQENALAIREYIGRIITYYLDVSTVANRTYVRYAGERLRIDSVSIDDALIGATYRFKSREQLRRLYVGFQIPAVFTIPGAGYRFNGEELLLISTERCALGCRLLDLQNRYHVQHSVISRGINFFSLWMNQNWGYLLRDNLQFWHPYLVSSMTAIKEKMVDQYEYDVDELQEVFKLAMFIDCTMIRSQRPGGGPVVPGRYAPRYAYLVQEAFYNGWKRIHGIKKQSVGLANGMAFHVSRGQHGLQCCQHGLQFCSERPGSTTESLRRKLISLS